MLRHPYVLDRLAQEARYDRLREAAQARLWRAPHTHTLSLGIALLVVIWLLIG